MYEFLQKSGVIGNLNIPNRVFLPAMGVNLGSSRGGVTDDLIAFYEARARGGCGLIISEVTRIEDGVGVSDPCQLAARGVSDIPDLQRLVDAIHKYDTRFFVQLQHPGASGFPADGESPVGASAITLHPGGPVPRELSTSECREYVKKFVNSARIVQMAGADGVELHGAHGYLINNFLSPAMNHRNDEYGGCFENRMRFLTEIIAGIRTFCGKRFPISVRINAEEMLEGGIDLSEAVKIAVAAEKAGADAINVSCYSDGCIEPGTYEQGWKKYMASTIHNAVGIPVLAVCNIKDPSVAESLLREGCFEFAGAGRAQLADPEWCKKAFTGKDEEIRKCIGCLACFSEIVKARRVRCAVNPVTGREREYCFPDMNGAGRCVAVIGGGPAGIQAALVLKSRGFEPVLFDENSVLGGTLNIADKGYGKDKITRYRESLEAQIAAAGIETRLGKKISVREISKLNPCGIFLATGAEPVIPPVPGIEGSNVVTAESVLLGSNRPVGKTVVIGSGMTGLETAEILADSCEKLTLVEMLDSVGPGMYPSVVRDVMKRILPAGPDILTGHRLEAVIENGIELTRLSDGSQVLIQADTVILAVGVRPCFKQTEELKGFFPDAIIIGDARRGGRILEAVQDAQGRAFTFNPWQKNES